MRKPLLVAAPVAFLIAVFAGIGAAAPVPDTAIASWADHDSADPIDEDGNGTETTAVTYSVTNANSAQYSLDGGPWITVRSTSHAEIVLPADGAEHALSLRARNSKTGAVDPTPVAAKLTMCPQAGCGSTPPPPPPPSGGGGMLYFYDGFERDADSFFPPWSNGCWGGKGGSVETDPTLSRSGSYSAKMTVYEGDCPSWPTRANLRWSEKFNEGDERYIGYSMYLPADFPKSNPGWMNLGQFGYGPPWSYPPFHFSYWGNGTEQGMIVYDQNTNSVGDIPVKLGAWNDVAMRVKFSSDSSVGYLEVYKDGALAVPLTRMNTLRDDATGAGSMDLQLYRQNGAWPSPLTVWFDEAKVGDSYADVAP